MLQLNLEQDYIINLDHFPTNFEITNIIKAKYKIPRMAVLKNGNILFEISDSNILNIAGNKIKDLLALRYLNTFSELINNYFKRQNINRLLWIGDESVFQIIQQEIKSISTDFRTTIHENENLSDYDAIIDNKYYDLLEKLNINGKVLYFFEILENELIEFLMEKIPRSVKMFFCKMPTYEQLLPCLTDFEKEQYYSKKSSRYLIKNEELLNSFIPNPEEKAFFLRQDYMRSTMFDDGEKIIQANISYQDLNVLNGVRKTLPEHPNGKNRIYLLGTCTVFGFYTQDHKTIASYLQKLLLENNLDYTVINKGIMQGQFVLNTLITALQCQIKPGDKIILLDCFEGYSSKISDKIIDTSKWFISDKNSNQHMFFDKPAHCNVAANQIFAKNCFNMIKQQKNSFKEQKSSKSFLNLLNLSLKDDFNKYLMIASIYSHRQELSKYTKIQGKKGIVIIYACPFTLGHKHLIDEALKIVNHLFVFVITEFFHGYSMLDRFDMVKNALLNYSNITLIHTENYMVSKQYFPKYGNRSINVMSSDNLIYEEWLTEKYLYKYLDITYRFLGEEKEDYVTSVLNQVVKKSSAENNIKCIIIPRKTINNCVISAKTFRAAINSGNIELARKLVPDTTLKHYFSHMRIASNINVILHKNISNNEEAIIHEKLEIFFSNINIIKSDGLENKIPEANMNIHFGLNGNYTDCSTLDFFMEKVEDLNDSYINKLMEYFTIISKRILLYLGKFPDDENDMDGGSQLSWQLINTLKTKSILDVTFIRKGIQTYQTSYVNQINYIKYQQPDENKFLRRLININTNKEALSNSSEYDLIIAAHCSKLFGLAENIEIMNKSVIFPMFLTNSYKRAGEDVPESYTNEEQKILKSVSTIITPSLEEKIDILNDYKDISGSKIEIIPRGVNLPKRNLSKQSSNQIKLVSIGSIKKQKNHIDDLILLNLIRKLGYDASLTIIGSLYDKNIQEELNKYAKENNLSSFINYYEGLTREKLSNILSQMTFGISNSNWETFGRGILECLAAGLPTIVTDKVLVLKNLINSSKGLYFKPDLNSMVNTIIELYKNQKQYEEASEASLNISNRFSLNVESERLLYVLIFNRFKFSSEFSLWNLEECQKLDSNNYIYNNHRRRMLSNMTKTEVLIAKVNAS